MAFEKDLVAIADAATFVPVRGGVVARSDWGGDVESAVSAAIEQRRAVIVAEHVGDAAREVLAERVGGLLRGAKAFRRRPPSTMRIGCAPAVRGGGRERVPARHGDKTDAADAHRAEPGDGP